MAQFPMSESRRGILERFPDYSVVITPSPQSVVIKHRDITLAQSERALLIQESKHKDVYYLPREDVRMDLMVATSHRTYCPFKGHATYYSLVADTSMDNFVWAYDNPYPQVAALKGYLSFYTNRVTQTTE